MSERAPSLTRARCPACGTVFRVTAEQLRLKGGKVRCGECQKVFNAFDHLHNEPRPQKNNGSGNQDSMGMSAIPPQTDGELRPTSPITTEAAPPIARQVDEPLDQALDLPLNLLTPAPAAQAPVTPTAAPTAAPPAATSAPTPPPAPVPTPAPTPAAAPLPTPAPSDSPSKPLTAPANLAETPEESTQAAREAGLVAVRELNDAGTTFNRWSAGALASDGLSDFGTSANTPPLWLYLGFFGVLLTLLLGQLLHHYRTEVVLRVPALEGVYAVLGVTVPLPKNEALVSIETSDLQLDNSRGLFVLNATLKNQAPYAQAWPSLELTLTDINDRVIARRIIAASEYLPPDAPTRAFAANADTAVRLWIDATGGAAGYRLYIFYP